MTKARDIASAAPAPSTVSATELGYLDGVSSAIQTQIDGKQAANANVSTTELGYLDGVTSAIQTQLDAKIPKTLTTTTGDIIYASSANTPARLGIGSTSQVLTVSGGVPAWATPSSGALTKITSASFSAQSSVAIDDVFTSTYKMYYITWFCTASVSGADLELQFRYAGPTTQTANYYTSGFGYKRDNSLITYGGVNASVGVLYPDLGSGAGGESTGDITFANVGNASENPLYFGKGYGQLSQAAISYAGYEDVQRTYTGFLLKPSSGTITGYYRVYGLAN